MRILPLVCIRVPSFFIQDFTYLYYTYDIFQVVL